jgi:hypothetical protein
VLQSEQAPKFSSMYYAMLSLYCKAFDLRRAMHTLMAMILTHDELAAMCFDVRDGDATDLEDGYESDWEPDPDHAEAPSTESEPEEVGGVMGKRARDRARARYWPAHEQDLVFSGGAWSPVPRPLSGFSVQCLREWMRPANTMQYNILLDLFAKLLYKPAVDNVRRDMEERGTSCFSSFYCCYNYYFCYLRFTAFSRFSILGFKPTVHTYAILFLMHVRMRSGMSELQRCLNEMAARGISPSMKRLA